MEKKFMPNDFGWTPQDEEFHSCINHNAAQETWEAWFERVERLNVPSHLQGPIWDDGEADDLCGHSKIMLYSCDGIDAYLDKLEEAEEFYDWEQADEDAAYYDAITSEYAEVEREIELKSFYDQEDDLRRLVRHPNRNLNKVA